PMRWIPIGRCGIGIALATALFSGGCTPAPAPAPGDQAPPEEAATPIPEAAPFTVRQTTAPTFIPGQSNTFSVRMDYTGTDPVTAMALQIEAPPDWQFGGIAGPLHPAVEPPAGARGELTFIWIQIP